MHLLSTVTRLAAGLLLLATGDTLSAQVWTASYYPDNKAGVDGYISRWKETAVGQMPNNTRFHMNIWSPFNTYGTRWANGQQLPMGANAAIYNFTTRNWQVSYDINGPMPSSSPFYYSDKPTTKVKGFPHVSWKPATVLGAWMGGSRVFKGEWDLEVTSNSWAAHQFNVIWEIRLARYNPDNTIIKNSEYIIQIELFSRGFGSPSSTRTSLSGYTWGKGELETVASSTSPDGVPVYRFMWVNAPIYQNTRRQFTLDLFQFVEHVSAYPNQFANPAMNRGSMWARIQSVNAGIELANGWSSTFKTHSYWVDDWSR